MRRNTSFKISQGLWAVLPLAFLLFGCDAESPTAPTPTPVPPVTNNPPAQSTWNITISASPDEFEADGTSQVSNITITARRADNGTLVPNGTTALLTTSSGSLTSTGGTGQSVPIVFDNTGTAFATLNFSTATAGTIVLRAQIEQSFASKNIQLFQEEVEPLQIRSISPVSGPPTGGTLLTVTGQGFQDPVRLSFQVGGQTLLLSDVQLSGSTKITARTPAVNLDPGQNLLATLLLENGFDETGAPGGTDSITSAFTYTRSNSGGGVPTTLKILSLSPTSGPNEGGTRVTILGEGFGSQVQVYFTAGQALIEAQIVSVTATRLEVITPAATGPNASNRDRLVDLRLIDSQTGATATRTGAFQYGGTGTGSLFVSSVGPGQDEYLGGTLVTIFGQGFDEPVAVSFNSVAQQVLSVTGTEILVRSSRVNIGCAQSSGAVRVVNIETNDGASGPNFIYVPIQPNVIGVSPVSGPQTGGTQIVIQGSPRNFGIGFQAPLRVLVNGVLANVVSSTATQITAIVPPFSGTFATTACTIAGPPAQTGTQNVPFGASIEVINLDNDCQDTLEAGFTYLPSDVSCHPPDAAP